MRASPAVIGFVVLTTAAGHAQLGRPKAEVTPIAAADGARAGTPARVAVRVSLPEGLHTQSNKPRDPKTMALALPFLLGVGMAVPWPIAGAGLAALPKPGAWMVRVKQVLGVIILATAAYYGYEAYRLFANRFCGTLAIDAISYGETGDRRGCLDRDRRCRIPPLSIR